MTQKVSVIGVCAFVIAGVLQKRCSRYISTGPAIRLRGFPTVCALRTYFQLPYDLSSCRKAVKFKQAKAFFAIGEIKISQIKETDELLPFLAFKLGDWMEKK